MSSQRRSIFNNLNLRVKSKQMILMVGICKLWYVLSMSMVIIIVIIIILEPGVSLGRLSVFMITRGHLVEQSKSDSTHSSVICGTSDINAWSHQGDHQLVTREGMTRKDIGDYCFFNSILHLFHFCWFNIIIVHTKIDFIIKLIPFTFSSQMRSY